MFWVHKLTQYFYGQKQTKNIENIENIKNINLMKKRMNHVDMKQIDKKKKIEKKNKNSTEIIENGNILV